MSNVLVGNDTGERLQILGSLLACTCGKASVATRFTGMFIYLAPEYAAAKGNVYGFGVILMELISRGRALEESLPLKNH